ncbi:hypothetical protein GGTG_10686 [Gaeumannomyces tritici R3-111a-1]|uniref:lytic cellulose monooxygenase (C4-dehydrogenating) n=1 Tax=Gaeumannomyces tritici (strain R3-111a-1) TaxID=644352 RepID=J3PB12_GAET3|nr:hypothetical protein GGTG_10686 [Gaeumannomyces tritici R3-111a-1]EJT71428.1 hypothetical protein GGTG_10686 [Gaeumannomyces tritici R3-111a-1]
MFVLVFCFFVDNKNRPRQAILCTAPLLDAGQLPVMKALPVITSVAWRLVVLARLAHLAGAHGGLNNYTVGDTWYRGYDPTSPREDQEGAPWMVQRLWSTIDPLTTASSPFISCNQPGSPPPPSYIPIEAGAVLGAAYWYWLHPVGPMTVWLAPCLDPDLTGARDCRDLDPSDPADGVRWFKIWEAGFLPSNDNDNDNDSDQGGGGGGGGGGGDLQTGTWYQKAFQRWDGLGPAMWEVRLPPRLRPGLYMVRHEIVSLHVAGRPQFYPECAHLNISGAGDDLPPREFWRPFPGAYDGDEPSLMIDIYSDEMKGVTNYTIPGGPIWERFDTPIVKYCLNC